MRTALSMLICLLCGVMYLPRSASAQDGCPFCQDCEFGEHLNGGNGWIGNHDATHPCWAHSCIEITYSGVHNPNCYYIGSAPEEAFRGTDVMSPRAAARLVANFPERIVPHFGGMYVQLLDCRGERVLAQAEVVGGVWYTVGRALSSSKRRALEVLRGAPRPERLTASR